MKNKTTLLLALLAALVIALGAIYMKSRIDEQARQADMKKLFDQQAAVLSGTSSNNLEEIHKGAAQTPDPKSEKK